MKKSIQLFLFAHSMTNKLTHTQINNRRANAATFVIMALALIIAFAAIK